MKVVAITQARSGSTRLPNKVMLKVEGVSLLELHLNRISKSKLIDELILATTVSERDDQIAILAQQLDISYYRGSEHDVLDRFYQAVKDKEADYIVRLTSDCPLIDAALIDKVIQHTLDNQLDYCSNVLAPSYPDGEDVEVFKFSALEEAWHKATLPSEREHVTPFIHQNSSFFGKDKFRSANFSEGYDYGHLRITVDEPRDLELIHAILAVKDQNCTWLEYVQYLEKHPDIKAINNEIKRNEGILKSLEEDKKMGTGQKLYKKAKTLIPGGTMLLSKRPEMFLPDLWPSYFSKAKGCTIWDLDGKEYLDMSIMGIGTNTLGYGHEEVDDAVRKVIDNGNMSTLNCPEEVELAERLCTLHPWADMVRLCRTGGEANAVSIRIARAASGKDKVAICGYHGWHDWYLSTNLEKKEGLDGHLLPGLDPSGVPKGLKGSTIPFIYNDLGLVEDIIKNNKDLGVIKMEVSRNMGPAPGYLEGIRALTKKHGIILMFDECTSGFRETNGGLHKKYGVEPDMAMFGKTLGNGYAITAVIGSKEIMQAAQKTFISSTFWTERIGPTAALATLDVMENINSWETITQTGKNIKNQWLELGKKYELDIATAGLDSLATFSIKSDNWLAYKTFIAQEMLKQGILASSALYSCIAHTPDKVEIYFNALSPIFKRIQEFENGDDVYKHLDGPVCHGGFKRLN